MGTLAAGVTGVSREMQLLACWRRAAWSVVWTQAAVTASLEARWARCRITAARKGGAEDSNTEFDRSAT